MMSATIVSMIGRSPYMQTHWKADWWCEAGFAASPQCTDISSL